MADYPTLLDGMLATIQTTSVPGLVMRRFLAPPMADRNGVASRAPLGLRRLAAALSASGLGDDDIAVVSPSGLDRAIGPATRVVGISSGDPLGRGMSSTTMAGICGGQLYTRIWFADLCRHLGRLRGRGGGFRVVVGGPGAWQLANEPAAARDLGIDTVFVGYGEREAPGLFDRLIAGESVEGLVRAGTVPTGNIAPITAATSMGAVEVSRGCGRGCGFCTLAGEPMVHMGIEDILAAAETNVRAGPACISLISEDLLRYGATGSGVAPEALLEMLHAVRAVAGVRMIQGDHANVSSVMQLTDSELRAVREAMRASGAAEQSWLNLGVESASGELLTANGLAGKVRPFEAGDWSRLCEAAVRRMGQAGFVPMVSLILGLPGETAEHVDQTIELLARLEGLRVVVFPIFYAPLSPGERPFGVEDMTERHWRLFQMSYAFNFKWIPQMFRDNHRLAGTPWRRRLFVQLAGRVQTIQWKRMFRSAIVNLKVQ